VPTYVGIAIGITAILTGIVDVYTVLAGGRAGMKNSNYVVIVYCLGAGVLFVKNKGVTNADNYLMGLRLFTATGNVGTCGCNLRSESAFKADISDSSNVSAFLVIVLIIVVIVISAAIEMISELLAAGTASKAGCSVASAKIGKVDFFIVAFMIAICSGIRITAVFTSISGNNTVLAAITLKLVLCLVFVLGVLSIFAGL
jgi:hypothetical protein